jgi:hypothetical protein
VLPAMLLRDCVARTAAVEEPLVKLQLRYVTPQQSAATAAAAAAPQAQWTPAGREDEVPCVRASAAMASAATVRACSISRSRWTPPAWATGWPRVAARALTAACAASDCRHRCSRAFCRRTSGCVAAWCAGSRSRRPLCALIAPPQPALRTACQLVVRGGAAELLRRVCIIVLEDAILHPAFPYLVRALAARAGSLCVGQRAIARSRHGCARRYPKAFR